MLKANIINESFDNMLRNIINESKLTEDTINDEDELRSALTDAVSKLMEDRIINLKQYEIALQDAIEKIYPDYSWWEITSTNIFMDLFEKRDPWIVVDDIMNTLTIPGEEEDQEYSPSLTSDDTNGGQWYEGLKSNKENKPLKESINKKPIKESKKLDEKVPNDLIRSIRADDNDRRFGGPYTNTDRQFNRGGYWSGDGVVDYENSDYKTLSPQEVLGMKKRGEDLSNIYVIKNGEHIKLNSDGSPSNYGARDIRSNQSLKKTLDGADKIYLADEKLVKDTQPEKFASRNADPEERRSNLELGAKGPFSDEEGYRKGMYTNSKSAKKAIARAKQDYEDGDISRKEMERIIAYNQPSIDTYYGKGYQNIRDKKADARNYAANKSASAKVSEYKELKQSIPEAERAISRAKDDIEKFNNGQSTSGWSDYGYNKRSADRYRKEIEDLERKLEFAKKQLQSYESKLTDDAKGSELKALEDKLAKANDDLEAKTSRLKALLRKNEALRRISKSKKLDEAKKDLSEIDGTVSNAVQKNLDRFGSCESVADIVKLLKEIFKEEGIDNESSRTVINKVSQSRTPNSALTFLMSYWWGGVTYDSKKKKKY